MRRFPEPCSRSVAAPKHRFCVDVIDRFGADRLAIGIAEGHFPLGNVLVVAELGPVAGDVFIGKGAEGRNDPFGLLPGILVLEGVFPGIQELPGVSAFAGLRKRDLALGSTAQPHFPANGLASAFLPKR